MYQRVLSTPTSPDFCQLTYDESRHWLRATWTGYVSPEYALNGASAGLEMLQQIHCPYLLNDNSRLQGPWFDSLEWLATEWGPAAANAGLRYVAHVAQPNALVNAWLDPSSQHLLRQFEIQVFESEAEAVEWLSSCQRQVG